MIRSLLYSLFLILCLHPAYGATELSELANGEHSFRTLGPGFYVDVPVRRIPDDQIQLSFVNYKLAEKLGIRLPTDPVELERFAKDAFAYEVDPTGQSSKTWIATHYLDSPKKGEGQAMGDGRALWTGELKLERPDGRLLYVDAVIKGVGQTPFAWLKNESHSDGKQSIEEMVNSAFLSLAGERNQLDTTADLFGFRVAKDGAVKSMTLRLGNQTRVAHPSFHADNKQNFKKMMDYIVARDLGLPLETRVTRKSKSEWIWMFTNNIAAEAARFYDLDLIQESPTNGNKTSRGGTIDLAGLRYLDGYHTEYKHLFHQLKVSHQNHYIKSYIDRMVGYMKKAGYVSILSHPFLLDRLHKQFQMTFAAEFSTLALNRLGLSAEEIARIPADVKKEFVASLVELKTARGSVQVDLPGGNKKVIPAAFETRRILMTTMKVLAAGDTSTGATSEIFQTDRRWRSGVIYPTLRSNYLISVKRIMESLGSLTPQPSWIARAQEVGQHTRKELPRSSDFYDRYTGQAVEVARGGRLDFQTLTTMIESAADQLSDRTLPERPLTMLKAKEVRSIPSSRSLSCPAAFAL